MLLTLFPLYLSTLYLFSAFDLSSLQRFPPCSSLLLLPHLPIQTPVLYRFA